MARSGKIFTTQASVHWAHSPVSRRSLHVITHCVHAHVRLYGIATNIYEGVAKKKLKTSNQHNELSAEVSRIVGDL